ncbi:MAG: hypothetical protein LC642_02855 [Verrucomicrobiaceae bacterium]|nr:hypothetical protein [Verrucomicrobiaceae bacterium]
MTIPFLSYFKRSKGEAAATKQRAAAVAKPAPPPLEKPSSERFSKTVMPNATRTVAAQDPFQMAARSTAMGGQASATAVAPAPATSPRTISFAAPGPAPASMRNLPPAVALALEPNVERVISLELADVVAGMPPGHVKPLGEDGDRRILVRASEVEKGMANGKPSVSLATIYEQVPEIFLRTISPSDTWQVQLPFAKVLDQFTSLHVRADQERHLVVPQVETPFLKVAVFSSRAGASARAHSVQNDAPLGRPAAETRALVDEGKPGCGCRRARFTNRGAGGSCATGERCRCEDRAASRADLEKSAADAVDG